MNIVVLGAGAVGAAAAEALHRRGYVDVIVADLSVERAEFVAHRHGAAATRLDLTDRHALDGLLSDAEAVINTAGPFYRFGTTVLRSALRTATTYVDVADDPTPTLDMLELDEEARSAAVTAVVGAGASPGLSNMLAVLAAQRLDVTHEVVTAWPEDPVEDLSALGPTASAATVHWIHQLSRPVPALRDGALHDIAPLDRMDLLLPRIGVVPAWTVGHPEAVTLHRALFDLRSSTNVMMLRPYDADVLRSLLAEFAAADTMDEEAAAAEVRRRYANVDHSRREADLACPHLLAQALGHVGDRPARATAMLTAYPDGGMGPITAIPAVLALEQLLEHPRPGVHPPEVIIDPERMFADLVAFIPAASSIDDVISIDVSHEDPNDDDDHRGGGQ